MKKVLWLSNFTFRECASTCSGTWIEAMGKGLVSCGECQIVNVTMSNVDSITCSEVCGIIQYELPSRKLRNGFPPEWMIKELQKIESKHSPDLIHVWGTEVYWGLMTVRGYLKTPALLEMQGLTWAMTPYMTGCLTQDEIRKCFGLKEILRPHTDMKTMQREYASRYEIEREIIAGHRYIDYESDWVRSYIGPMVCDDAKFFKTRLILREKFLTASPWEYKKNCMTVFSSCGCSPNKGCLTLIRAIALLSRRFPNIKLEISGNRQRGIRRSGFQKFVEREIIRLGLSMRVQWLGLLDSDGLIAAMHRAAVVVVPSYVESYSMSLAEAMAVGCPCVATYAGAMPEVGGDSVSYFSIADAGSCAMAITKVFEAGEIAEEIGVKALHHSRGRHDCHKGVSRQMEIYADVINDVQAVKGRKI